MSYTSAETFVDTTVWVYAVDITDLDKQTRAQAVIEQLGGAAVISTQVIAEFWSVVTCTLVPPVPRSDARAAVRHTAGLDVVSIDAALVVAAAAHAATGALSLWDAQIIEAAPRSGCRRVLTDDLATGSVIDGVRIENPFDV